MTSTTGPTPGWTPVDDPAAAAAACADRAIEREGVAVVLALHDRRGGTTAPGPPPAPAARDEGAAVRRAFDAYAAALEPDAADDDADALYRVVELLGWMHVDPTTPGPSASDAPARAR